MSAAPAAQSARTAATRERLYVAAIALFGEHGIDQVSVEEIAAAAGVAKGTVYYNFRGKDALVGALIEDRIAGLVAAIDDIANDEHAIAALIETLLRFVEEQTKFAQLIVGELWRPASRWRDELIGVRERLISAIEPLLAGAASNEILTRTAAGGIVVTCLGIGLDWQVYPPVRTRAEVTSQVLLLFGHS